MKNYILIKWNYYQNELDYGLLNVNNLDAVKYLQRLHNYMPHLYVSQQ
jgi:hypothetical protein